mgnify:CR=1 FL=1
MAIFKQGIANSTSPLSSRTNSLESIISRLKSLESFSIPVRVTDIVLNDSHPRFNEVGQYNGIGAIFFESFDKISSQSTNFALPYSSHIKTFPLVDEFILITSLPDQGRNNSPSSVRYFYHNPIGIWNTPNHNAFPFLPSTPPSTNNYQSNLNGQVQQENNQLIKAQLNSPTNPSQDSFIEKENIRSIAPKSGDTLIEGRNGQSIRFSNNEGNPITLIRNGQNRQTPSTGFEPISENVKNDLSSIYLTSYQAIPNLSLETEKGIPFISYSSPPITPSQYNQPQAILNSDRIVIEAETDSVLISAGKSVGLFSNESINIESKDINIHTDNIIRLGSKSSDEPVLLGNQTYIVLEYLIKSLTILSKAVGLNKEYPEGTIIPDNVNMLSADNVISVLEHLENKILPKIKSTKVKVE